MAASYCTTSDNSVQFFDTQGHRGCRGLMPENTIPAMYKAIDLGVTTLEMDIVFTLDQQAILSHEPFFNHEITIKPDGRFVSKEEERSLNIYQMDYAQVKKYDVGLKGHPSYPRQKHLPANKPLLSDVFVKVKEYCRQQNKPVPFFNIETKTNPETDNKFHPAPEQFVDLLMKVINENKMMEHVIIQSFDKRTLQYLREKYTSIPTAFLVEEPFTDLKQSVKELGFVPTIFSPYCLLVNDDMIETAHELNMKLIPWTVNDLSSMKRLKKMGVDGIISDYPDLFSQLQ